MDGCRLAEGYLGNMDIADKINMTEGPSEKIEQESTAKPSPSPVETPPVDTPPELHEKLLVFDYDETMSVESCLPNKGDVRTLHVSMFLESQFVSFGSGFMYDKKDLGWNVYEHVATRFLKARGIHVPVPPTPSTVDGDASTASNVSTPTAVDETNGFLRTLPFYQEEYEKVNEFVDQAVVVSQLPDESWCAKLSPQVDLVKPLVDFIKANILSESASKNLESEFLANGKTPNALCSLVEYAIKAIKQTRPDPGEADMRRAGDILKIGLIRTLEIKRLFELASQTADVAVMSYSGAPEKLPYMCSQPVTLLPHLSALWAVKGDSDWYADPAAGTAPGKVIWGEKFEGMTRRSEWREMVPFIASGAELKGVVLRNASTKCRSCARTPNLQRVLLTKEGRPKTQFLVDDSEKHAGGVTPSTNFFHVPMLNRGLEMKRQRPGGIGLLWAGDYELILAMIGHTECVSRLNSLRAARADALKELAKELKSVDLPEARIDPTSGEIERAQVIFAFSSDENDFRRQNAFRRIDDNTSEEEFKRTAPTAPPAAAQQCRHVVSRTEPEQVAEEGAAPGVGEEMALVVDVAPRAQENVAAVEIEVISAG